MPALTASCRRASALFAAEDAPYKNIVNKSFLWAGWGLPMDGSQDDQFFAHLMGPVGGAAGAMDPGCARLPRYLNATDKAWFEREVSDVVDTRRGEG